MARANTAQLDGLTVGYGARDTINAQGAMVHTLGNTGKEYVVVVDYSNIASFATATAAGPYDFEIPAGSVIRSANLVVEEGVTDLTSLVVGLKEADGTTNDDNGLIDTTLQAAIGTAGITVEGAGAHVDGPVLAVDSFVSIDVTGTAPTAGRVALTVTYDMPHVSQDAPGVISGLI